MGSPLLRTLIVLYYDHSQKVLLLVKESICRTSADRLQQEPLGQQVSRSEFRLYWVAVKRVFL